MFIFDNSSFTNIGFNLMFSAFHKLFALMALGYKACSAMT